MKTIKAITLCAIAAMLMASCSTKTAKLPAGITKAQVDSASFYIGQNFGMTIKMSEFENINLNEVVKGIKSIITKDELDQMEMQAMGQEMQMYLQTFFQQLAEAKGAENAAKGAKFLEENGKKDGVITTESGLQYQIIRQGEGARPTSVEDVVRVCYEGSTLDGKIFDSSYERNDTISFALNQVIKGWGEGLQLVNEGGEIILWIPADIAYGERGAGNVIGPNETLKFKVELIKVEEPAPAEEN